MTTHKDSSNQKDVTTDGILTDNNDMTGHKDSSNQKDVTTDGTLTDNNDMTGYKDSSNQKDVTTDGILTDNNDMRGHNDGEFPLKYCVIITNHPIISFVFTLVLHICIILVTVLLIVMGYKVFPVDFKTLPLVLYDDPTRTQDLAWRFAMKYENRTVRPIITKTPPQKFNGVIIDRVEMTFKGNYIFSEKNLQLINESESRIFDYANTISSFCFINMQNICEKPNSILRLFDGTYGTVDPAFNSKSYDNATDVICKAMMYNQTREFVEPLLEKHYNPCDMNKISSKTRLFILLGWSRADGYDDDKVVWHLVFKIKPELEKIRDELLDHKMSLIFYSVKMYIHDVEQEAFSNMKLAIGSFIFIFIFMWLQTSSLWISFFGILSIVTSFLFTNLIYRFVLQYQYFGFFHIISIFIILGIGADDVFIFYDTWRLSIHTCYPSKAHRLSACYKKAAKTTFVTSVTTMAAFLVNAPSPLLPISSFGIFSGILIGVNYLFDLLCSPVVIIAYSDVIQPLLDKLLSYCSKFRQISRTTSQQMLILDDSGTQSLENIDTELISQSNDIHEDGIVLISAPVEISYRGQRSIQEANTTKQTTRDRIISFFTNQFFRFITWRPARITIQLLFIGISLFFVYNITTLEPDNKQVEVYIESHNYAQAIQLHYNGFKRNYENEDTKVHLSWGLKPQDVSSCNRKSGDICLGQPKHDEHFSLQSEEAQIVLMDMCLRLENLTDAEIHELRIKRNSVTNKPEISCFMSALYRYIQGITPSDNHVFPFTKDSVTKFMQDKKYIFDVSSLPPDFDRYFEILVSYWLSDGYTFVPTEDYWIYNHLIGEQNLPGITNFIYNLSENGKVYGTKLRYIGVEINTTLSFHNIGYPEGKPIYQSWEKYVQEEVSKMPASLKSGFQSATSTWHWIKIQETLVNSARSGLIIGISLALPILIFTTLNFIIGLIATGCIAMVTVVVVGSIPLAGWKLGFLESINLGLVVGLSVDYIVHLAEAYRTSPSLTREGRVKSMLENMAVSVLSGAITTFGAASFMLFAQIKFSFQFGIFVMSTVGVSIMFSLLFFPAFMASWGPQGNTGSIPEMLKFIKVRCFTKPDSR